MELEKTIKLDKKAALKKAGQFCAYQERSQQEVRDKLYSWGLWLTEVEEIIAELIENNFLNEERFAKAYVSGKFNIKKWGRIKIRQGLKLKQITDKMISSALNTIDEDDYMLTILILAQKKLPSITVREPHKRRFKLISYLLSKGFENNLILDVLKSNNLT